MGTREADPYSNEEIWRRLLALVVWKGESERAFCGRCEINYNQWNNYKREVRLPSRNMLERIARRTGVDYMWIRFDETGRLTRQQEDEILPLLKRDQ